MKMMKTKTGILATAMDVVALEIKSDDGIANEAIAEAAERLREQEIEIEHLKNERNKSALIERQKYLPKLVQLERELKEAKLLLDLARNDRDINSEKLAKARRSAAMPNAPHEPPAH